MVYFHSGVLCSSEKKEHLQICRQMIGIRKKIIPSVVIQTQKDKYIIYEKLRRWGQGKVGRTGGRDGREL